MSIVSKSASHVTTMRQLSMVTPTLVAVAAVALPSAGATGLAGSRDGVHATAASALQDLGRATGSAGARPALAELGAKLTGAAELGNGGFGDAVAVSGDGTTALVGGSSDDDGIGAAWVFVRSGSDWVHQGPKLSVPGAILFGSSVALSLDGNVALIGAPDSRDVSGAAWIFTRTNGRWSKGQELLPKGERGGGWFGTSVALSADGKLAFVGGPLNDSSEGSVWVFKSSRGRWTQQGPGLTGPSSAGFGGAFGTSVAVSASGATLLVGGNDAAWVFRSVSGGWRQEGVTLTMPGAEFGSAVALSADGRTVLIGDPASTGAGGAWVYTLSGSRWSPTAKLVATAPAQDGELGASVALSGSGIEAILGAPLADGAIGAAWTFARSGRGWAPTSELTGSGESGDGEFGSSVALSEDGTSALLGGAFDDDAVGAAWAFAAASG